MAIFLGPIKSKLIERIASDGKCTLISIDPAESLTTANPFLSRGSIYSGAYSFRNDNAYLGGVETLAVRRVLVASDFMSREDAYYLANCVRRALPSQAAVADAQDNWPGPDGEFSSKPLNYALHSGVTSNEHIAPAFSWVSRNSSWLAPLVLAIAISLVTELRNVTGTGWHAIPPVKSMLVTAAIKTRHRSNSRRSMLTSTEYSRRFTTLRMISS